MLPAKTVDPSDRTAAWELARGMAVLVLGGLLRAVADPSGGTVVWELSEGTEVCAPSGLLVDPSPTMVV